MQKVETTYIGEDLIMKPLIFNVLNSNTKGMWILSAKEKEKMLNERVFNFIYQYQPELKDKVDNFLNQNLDKKNFLALFKEEFNQLFTLKAIAIPLLMCAQKDGIEPQSRKSSYKSTMEKVPDFFLELQNLLLTYKTNDIVNKDEVLFEVYFESLKKKNIQEFKVSEKDIMQVGLVYNGNDLVIHRKILNCFFKLLNKQDYDEKFYINFFKEIREQSEEFNVEFHTKMQEEFGENYLKLSTFKKDEHAKITENICIKMQLNYKSYIQEYDMTQSAATNLVEDIIFSIKRQLVQYSEFKEEDYQILNTTTSLIFITVDKTLAEKSSQYFQLATDRLKSSLDNEFAKSHTIKAHRAHEIIKNFEKELSKVLDYIFLSSNVKDNKKQNSKRHKI